MYFILASVYGNFSCQFLTFYLLILHWTIRQRYSIFYRHLCLHLSLSWHNLVLPQNIHLRSPFTLGKRYIFSTKSVSSTIKEWDPLHKTYAPQDVESVNGAWQQQRIPIPPLSRWFNAEPDGQHTQHPWARLSRWCGSVNTGPKNQRDGGQGNGRSCMPFMCWWLDRGKARE